MAYKYSPKFPSIAFFLDSDVLQNVQWGPVITEVGGGSGDIVTSEEDLLKSWETSALSIAKATTEISTTLDEWVLEGETKESPLKRSFTIGIIDISTNIFRMFSVLDLMLQKLFTEAQFWVELQRINELCERSADSLNTMISELDAIPPPQKTLITDQVRIIDNELPNLLEQILKLKKKYKRK